MANVPDLVHFDGDFKVDCFIVFLFYRFATCSLSFAVIDFISVLKFRWRCVCFYFRSKICYYVAFSSFCLPSVLSFIGFVVLPVDVKRGWAFLLASFCALFLYMFAMRDLSSRGTSFPITKKMLRTSNILSNLSYFFLYRFLNYQRLLFWVAFSVFLNIQLRFLVPRCEIYFR